MNNFDGMLLNFDQSFINRFWDKVNKRNNNLCWEWIGARSASGYGVYGKPNKYAHRVSYVLHYGKLPMNLFVCHKCDNPICVNPYHLFLGNHSDNMKDRNKKKRSNLPKGEKHFNSKLSKSNVKEIRSVYKQRLFNQHELAYIFNVHVMTINDVIKGKSWLWVK